MLPTRQPAIGTFMNKMKYSDDLQGTCNRSIHLLELRFHWSIQVDFMRHVIYVNRQSHVSNCHTSHRRSWSFVIATSCCCLESRSWSCDWGKLALRSIWAPSRAESTHTENGTQGSSNIRRGFACHFSLSFIWGRLIVNCLDSAY